MKLSLTLCQRRLALVWIIGAGVLFLFVLIQSSLGHYDNSADAWNWLLPAVLPTASLIVTALFKTLQPEEKMADRFLFRLCFSLSAVYLLTLLAVLLLQPLQQSSGPAEALKHSQICLGPFQGIVVSSVGAFFGQTEKAEPLAQGAAG